MSTAEIVDVTNFARGFPPAPDPEISRDYLLDTIDKIFEGRTDVLLIEGEEGIGKTILLRQFARRHYKNSLSLFLRPASRAATDPAYIAGVLAEQLHWMLHGEALRKDSVADSELKGYFSSLDRRFHRSRQVCYVIVDGLQEPAFSTQNLGDLILTELLPIGMPSFRFLLTGTSEDLGKRLHKSVSVRPYNITPCSLDEAIRYLDGLNLDRSQTEDLYRLCSKIFGRLAAVRRLLVAGIAPEKLLDESPPDFLELEWQKIESSGEVVLDVLKTLAYAQSSYNTPVLASITKHSEAAIEAVVPLTPFLTIDHPTGDVSFCSEAHRRYAQRKFARSRDEVLSSLIAYHSSVAVESSSPISPLPQYLQDADRFRELLSLLDTQYFLQIASRTQSLAALKRATRQGLHSSRQLDDLGSITRFTAQASFLSELSLGDALRAEIEARIQLGDKAFAVALAQRASLREDRLALLVTAAASLKRHLNEHDSTLLAQISSLVDQIDLSDLGERAIQIASELVAIDLDLAFRIIQGSRTQEAESPSLDTSIASLTLHTLNSRGDRTAAAATAARGLRTTKDPMVQRLLTSVSLFLETTSADDVIKHASSLDPSSGLFFLRQWAEMTRAFDEAPKVMDFGLDLLIKTAAYTPQVRDLRELSVPLARLTDEKALTRLVQRFDSQRATVMDLGTNVDLVRLHLHLATAEVRIDINRAHRRLLETYWLASDVRDLSTKAACLSWMVSHYHDIDIDNSLEKREGLLTVLRNDLSTTLEDLLRTTAAHFDVAKGALRALARRNTDHALHIASKLNIRSRRDAAYLEIVRSASRPSLATTNLTPLFEAINRISSADQRDDAVSALVIAFCKSSLDFGSVTESNLSKLCDLTLGISSSLLRARRLADLYDRVRRDGPSLYEVLERTLLEQIDRAWRSIDASWRKAKLAFQIARNLGKTDPATAKTYIAHGELTRKEGSIVTEEQFEDYVALVHLTIRAFSGLLHGHHEDDSTIRLLERVIDVIPSQGERAMLWSDAACRAHLMGRKDLCEAIVTKHVRPLLDLIPPDNLGAYWRVSIETAPALYMAHHTTALERIAKLPRHVAEKAAIEIADFILRRVIPSDAYYPRRTSNLKLKFEQFIDLFEVLKHIHTDTALYHYVRELVKCLSSKPGRNELTKQHYADIVDRIERDIASRFPDPENIQHEGYVLATLANIGKLRAYPLSQWEELIARAQRLPNSADKAYVLTVLASSMANRHKVRSDEILRDAKRLIDASSVSADRIDRLETLADAVFDVNPALAKECLKSAYTFACHDPDNDASHAARRRDLLDLAHTLDPEFAETLVQAIDDDPRRATVKADALEQVRTQKLERKLGERDLKSGKIKKFQQELSSAAWRSLGLLNGDWMEPLHVEQLRPYLDLCADVPLMKSSYPILAWIVENHVRRVGRTSAAKATFYNLFSSLAQSSEAAIAIVNKIGGGDQISTPMLSSATEDLASGSMIIRPGDRDKALRFIDTWISEAGEYIKVCDQYFTSDDLEVVRMFRARSSNLRIIVLTSKFKQPKDVDLEDHYRIQWMNNVSPYLPGNCDIVLVGSSGEDDFPIHDRWWIGNGVGLRVGTSFNSLGTSKASEISVLTYPQARALEQEIDALLQRTKREHKGRLINLTFLAL